MYEVKSNSCLIERLFKVKKNGAFLLGIFFFFLEIYTFLYYANEESDDVIGGSLKQCNTQSRISPEVAEECSSNSHQKCTSQEKQTPTMLLSWQHSRLQSLSVKNKYPHLQSF